VTYAKVRVTICDLHKRHAIATDFVFPHIAFFLKSFANGKPIGKKPVTLFLF
jgi:hypothetical protein